MVKKAKNSRKNGKIISSDTFFTSNMARLDSSGRKDDSEHYLAPENHQRHACRAIFVPRNFPDLQRKDSIIEACEKFCERDQLWIFLVKRDDFVVFLERNQFSSLIIEGYNNNIVTVMYEKISSSDFNFSPNSIRSTGIYAASSQSCQCSRTFRSFRNSIEEIWNAEFLTFYTCYRQTFIIIGEEQNLMSFEEFTRLEELLRQLHRNSLRLKKLLQRRIPIGERDGTQDLAIFNHIISYEEFSRQIDENIEREQSALKRFNTLVWKLSNDRKVEILQSDQGAVGPSNIEVTRASDNDTTLPRDSHVSADSQGSRSFSGASTVSLQDVFTAVATNLSNSDWREFRSYIERDIPLQVLENIPNDVSFFQELEKRNIVEDGNIEIIKNGLFDIERVDLVHLLDLLEDGDRSWLELFANGEKRSVIDNHSSVQDAASREQSRGRRDERNVNFTSRTESPARQMQNLMLNDGKFRVCTDSSGGDGTNEGRSVGSPMIFSNVPHGSSTYPPFPVQEQTLEERPNADLTNATDRLSGNTSVTSERTRGTLTEGTVERDLNADSESTVGTVGEDTRSWSESREYPCSHYERHCVVKFPCCDEFWPCHRCHNAKSQCGEKKVRSRDITEVRCRRCGNVQDFPKETPRCVECNLKFAEYFCSLCQHLTGTDNHPFHCEKCGICRIHGDRSFHCDVCGVCLDVHLRGNHKCRAGSAHDECCICFEDAFTGCQILPCSHKVHKDCATQMLRNGITRCPICRESFAHKIEKQPMRKDQWRWK